VQLLARAGHSTLADHGPEVMEVMMVERVQIAPCIAAGLWIVPQRSMRPRLDPLPDCMKVAKERQRQCHSRSCEARSNCSEIPHIAGRAYDGGPTRAARTGPLRSAGPAR